MECLIKLGTPVVALGLGGELPLLLREVRTNEVDLDERTEHAALYHPLQVVRCYHWKVWLHGSVKKVWKYPDNFSVVTHWYTNPITLAFMYKRESNTKFNIQLLIRAHILLHLKKIYVVKILLQLGCCFFLVLRLCIDFNTMVKYRLWINTSDVCLIYVSSL